MKTVQMTLDEDLVKAVDEVVRKLGTSRSAFTRQALDRALAQVRIEEQERCHRDGYARHPVADQEFSVWEQEQDWGDA
jgi:metal-responsive CopG/Arc/MetJ family transcriptional regulator